MFGELDRMLSTEPGHVVMIDHKGTAREWRGTGDDGPETLFVDYTGTVSDAQISDEAEREMAAETEREYGWEVLSGWSCNGGPVIMHGSQHIGGRLEEFIRETPGLWLAVPVEIGPDDPDGETDAAGWALLYRSGERDKEIMAADSGRPLEERRAAFRRHNARMTASGLEDGK